MDKLTIAEIIDKIENKTDFKFWEQEDVDYLLALLKEISE